jgi:urea transport system permease protein
MGMYLMRQIGSRGVYANPDLPDFMVFLNWQELPVYWWGFNSFPYALLMVVLVPGTLAFVFGWFAFRSRVTGVYFSIITQALTFALMLGFFRNNFGFGGNNWLTDFKDVLGFNVQAQGTRAALFAITCVVLAVALLMCRYIVTSKFGKVLIAIRDAESRTRFLGYRVESYKLLVFTLSACIAGVAGSLYVLQVGIINPGEFAPANSIEEVIWVAVGGRGTLIGAILGAVVVNYGKTYFTSGVLAPYWLFVLGGLFVGVTLLLPRGIVGTIQHYWAERRNRTRPTLTRGRSANPCPRSSRWKPTTTALLYLNGVDVSFDGFRALNEFVRRRARRDARHHRAERRRQDHHDGRGHRQDAAAEGRRLFRLRGSRLTRLDESSIAELGIGRKFQKPTVFESHTVEDNSPRFKADRRALATLFWRGSPQETARIDGISRPSGSPQAGASPAACPTARSSGSRSACCWRRSRS